ncbi:MAG: hypothetical protein A2651_03835 [Candidatus Yanofskybacteria bacterium RIFCSPHIGHO2_01_FULL_42_12]|uniref:Phosphoribosylformylglycinamidine cyclo-ligase n=1 Tax=Candidatus Yanofskybacteria bacterium RIFCSPLOWO2_01_FULL_42_49 TaxID=1802694 RepID=A0A1F8GCR1_9BACT|nr:MAG: hypothetical protein A2651_03835 [Candidatus Yanofskybacteria bacterium RIFCSPHIGHO2_01_FULL_42_12]OGN23123.1 MAG: hypothetical protein A2918_03740 [Candidatus Yanofskybacteria bacterium RIFCSPLOWO2_01_FULL_42_49]
MYKPSKPYKQKIINEIRKTWNSPCLSIKFNTYPIFKSKISCLEVDHTDGIGTKGFYHWQRETFKAAAIDALAMNLNDLATVRAFPYKLSNHITVPVEDERILKIVQAIARECKKYKIAMVGGENSFHDNTDGLDISMTVSGFIKNPARNRFQVGDVLIGLRSNGLHSNGMTKVRQVFGKEYRKEFTVPTRIYLYDILKLTEKCDVHGMMHITGGAFTKLKDILYKADAVIEHPKKLQPQGIFKDIYKKIFSNKVMYSTFNCGIGFVLSVPEQEVSKVLSRVNNACVIGKVTHGNGEIYIRSAFNDEILKL